MVTYAIFWQSLVTKYLKQVTLFYLYSSFQILPLSQQRPLHSRDFLFFDLSLENFYSREEDKIDCLKRIKYSGYQNQEICNISETKTILIISKIFHNLLLYN